MALFSHYIAVDWSAANTPRAGKDSIWIGEAGRDPANIPTRHAAIETLRARLISALTEGQRVLIGFDFAFGYPGGTIKAITGSSEWQALWAYLAENVDDRPDNRSNRFAVAEKMNARIGLAEGPFWGHPWQHSYENLSPKSPRYLPVSFPQKRSVETRVPNAKSVWQLAYNGAVGSQTVLGLAALQRLRTDPALADFIAVWPFQTNFSGDLSKPIILAEIYPSRHAVNRGAHSVLDAAQVMSVTQDLAAWDRTDALIEKLSAFGLSDAQRRIILSEEGWILGVS